MTLSSALPILPLSHIICSVAAIDPRRNPSVPAEIPFSPMSLT
nr:MAG TPA: hypothetical protein [Caudoviricetes sp.]